MFERRRLAPIALIVAATIGLGACGGDDETSSTTTSSSTTSGATGASGAEGATSADAVQDLDTIESNLESAGQDPEQLSPQEIGPVGGDGPTPVGVMGTEGGDLPEGVIVFVEQYENEEDAAVGGEFAAEQGLPYETVGVINYAGAPDGAAEVAATQADVDTVVEAAAG